MLLRERLAAMPEEQRLNTLETLPSFLADLGQAERLQTILTTYDFLKAKVDAIGVEQLINDYELTTDAEAKLIQTAIRLSAHVLVGDPEQLPGQLIGRLLTHRQPVIRVLLGQARAWHDKPWLHPRLPGLTSPGGPLWHILRGHSGEVDGLAIAEGRVVSGSEDKTVRVWNLASGECLHILQGHNDVVMAVAVAGGRIVSGSWDQTVRVWDLGSGKCLRILQGHTNQVIGSGGSRRPGDIGLKGQDGAGMGPGHGRVPARPRSQQSGICSGSS